MPERLHFQVSSNNKAPNVCPSAGSCFANRLHKGLGLASCSDLEPIGDKGWATVTPLGEKCLAKIDAAKKFAEINGDGGAVAEVLRRAEQ